MLGELCLSFPKQEKVLSGKGPFSIAQECDHIEENFGQLYYAEACMISPSSGIDTSLQLIGSFKRIMRLMHLSVARGLTRLT